MSSLISNSNEQLFTGYYGDFFDSFKKKIVVYKSPIRTAVNVTQQSMYGYETQSNETNFVYTPVSGIFYGIVSTPSSSDPKEQQIKDANISVNTYDLKLKVEKDARDFILDNKTERIEVEGRNYNLVGKDKRVSFLSKDFFMFGLKEMY